jgi:hypothetical protein
LYSPIFTIYNKTYDIKVSESIVEKTGETYGILIEVITL